MLFKRSGQRAGVEQPSEQGGTPLLNTAAMSPAELDIDDVAVARGGSEIIHGVSFHVKPGAFVGLLGPNGSGKSTLLRALYGASGPTRGSISIDGRDIATMKPRQLALQVAVMAQENVTVDFAMNADEVVMLGRTPHQSGFGADSPLDHGIVRQALADVDAAHLASREFGSLSGGEKQRVLLARAFAQQTPLLVLDEPTNHLDIGYQLDLLERVRRRGITVLAALHDMNLASEFCDELAVMVGGRLVAHGDSDDILTSPLLAEAFRVRTHHLIHPETGRPFVAISRKDTSVEHGN